LGKEKYTSQNQVNAIWVILVIVSCLIFHMLAKIDLLEKNITTLQHTLDYTQHRIDVLEKDNK